MTLKLVSDREGDHVHTRLYMGEDKDHLALCGALTFRVGEWQLFGAALRLGADRTQGHLEIVAWEDAVLSPPTDPLLDPMVVDALREVAEERRAAGGSL